MKHFLTRLAWTGTLSLHEQSQLQDALTTRRRFAAGSEIVPAGRRVDFSTVILSGMSCRQRFLRDGARQISAFQIPGDFCDLHSYQVKTLEENVLAITDCEVGLVPHEALDRITAEEPNITRLLWLYTLIDGSIYREWIVSLGRRSVLARLAHLVCELYLRLEAVGLAADHRYALPVTQQDISDAMGTSLVHTNRTLARMRDDGLATLAHRELTIHDWPGLRQVAEFDPLYLHLP